MRQKSNTANFPFLFGGAFIEARIMDRVESSSALFPFLFGRAFIEAWIAWVVFALAVIISLPFWKGFH